MAGTLFGEIGFHCGGPRTATVRRLKPCRLVRMDPSAVARLERDFPAAAIALHRFLARRAARRLVFRNDIVVDFFRSTRGLRYCSSRHVRRMPRSGFIQSAWLKRKCVDGAGRCQARLSLPALLPNPGGRFVRQLGSAGFGVIASGIAPAGGVPRRAVSQANRNPPVLRELATLPSSRRAGVPRRALRRRTGSITPAIPVRLARTLVGRNRNQPALPARPLSLDSDNRRFTPQAYSGLAELGLLAERVSAELMIFYVLFQYVIIVFAS